MLRPNPYVRPRFPREQRIAITHRGQRILNKLKNFISVGITSILVVVVVKKINWLKREREREISAGVCPN
jgi:hypothetical protein